MSELELYREILKFAKSPEGTKNLSQDIEQAAQTVKVIRSSFRNVGALIAVTTDERPDLVPLWAALDAVRMLHLQPSVVLIGLRAELL